LSDINYNPLNYKTRDFSGDKDKFNFNNSFFIINILQVMIAKSFASVSGGGRTRGTGVLAEEE